MRTSLRVHSSLAMVSLITLCLWQKVRIIKFMIQTNQSTAPRNNNAHEEHDDTASSMLDLPGWDVDEANYPINGLTTNSLSETSVQNRNDSTLVSSTINRPVQDIDILISRIIGPPSPPQTSTPTLHAFQEWEGYVEEVGEIDFVARLIDLTDESRFEEEAVIPLDELSDDDAARMNTGSIFRWVIGYERNPSGTKKRVSQIIFRDLPVITRSDLKEGTEWANKVIQLLTRPEQ